MRPDPVHVRSKNLKNNACLDTAAVFASIAAISWRASGLNSRASFTFYSSCATESHPTMTVLTGSVSV